MPKWRCQTNSNRSLKCARRWQNKSVPAQNSRFDSSAAKRREWGNASDALIHYDHADHSRLGVGWDPTFDGKPTRLIAGEIPLGLTAGSKLDFLD